MVLPTLVRGCWLYVECGSSASGRRRSLRYGARALNLPQVSNLREVGVNWLLEGVGPIYGKAPRFTNVLGTANPSGPPHYLEENQKYRYEDRFVRHSPGVFPGLFYHYIGRSWMID